MHTLFLGIVKFSLFLSLSLALSISLSLNFSLFLSDRDRADTIITFNPPPTVNFLRTLELTYTQV